MHSLTKPPLLGLLREDACVTAAAGAQQAPSYLFFGCRSAAKDFYYADLWRRLQAAGVLDREEGLVTAFSRNQPQKVYVTHRLAERAALLWHLLQQVGHMRPQLLPSLPACLPLIACCALPATPASYILQATSPGVGTQTATQICPLARRRELQ